MNRDQLLENKHFQSFAGGFFLIAVFLPIRFIFFTYVTDIWYYNIALIFTILVTIIYLTEKDRLGYLGKVVKVRLKRIKKSRAVKYLIVSSLFAIYLEVILFYGMTIDVDDQFQTAMTQTLLEQTGMAELTADEFQTAYDENPPGIMDYILILPTFFLLPYVDPQMFGFVIQSVDVLSNYWLSHFVFVGFAESVVMFGFMIWVRFIKKYQD